MGVRLRVEDEGTRRRGEKRKDEGQRQGRDEMEGTAIEAVGGDDKQGGRRLLHTHLCAGCVYRWRPV